MMAVDLSIVINGQDEPTEKTLRKTTFSYQRIGQTTPSHARNIALDKLDSSYDYVGFADDDILFGDRYFEHLIPLLESKKWDVVGGPDRTYPGSSPLESAIGLALTSPMVTGPSRKRHSYKEQCCYECDETSLSLCALWVRGSIFTLGYRFRPEYFRNEENILLYQLFLSNYRFYFSSKLYVFHKRKDNLKQLCLTVMSSGFHRIKSFFDYPRSASILYFLPLFFVVYLVSILFFHPIFWVSFFFIYVIVNIIFALAISYRSDQISLFVYIVFLQFFMNVSYGLGAVKLIFIKNKDLK